MFTCYFHWSVKNLVKNHLLFRHCFKLVSSNVPCTFPFWLVLDLSIHFLFLSSLVLQKCAITFNLVKWISAYLWQIKIEFVIALIPILWVPASMDFRKFTIQMDLSPSAHPVLCSLSILTFQIISWKHIQQRFYPNTNLLNILLPPLFTSLPESSFEIQVLFLVRWFQRFIFRVTFLTPISKTAYFVCGLSLIHTCNCWVDIS